MITPKEFELLNTPLEGTNLIEASAGTGKTYAIAGLFLRLILEKNLSVNEILVVTFTEAATEELKERIRTRLREAAEAFETGQGKDDFLNHLVKKIDDPRAALTRIREAIRTFDEAVIFTIHGFCRKMLHDNAFESGSFFDTELVIDQENIKRQIVYDFWRRHLYQASLLFVNYVIRNNILPDGLLSLFGNRVSNPDLKVIPLVGIPDTSQEERLFKDAFDDISRIWPEAKPEIEEILLIHEGLNRAKYPKAKIPLWIRAMDVFMTSGGKDPSMFEGFRRFSAGELEDAVKKGYSAPFHPFFYLCETMLDRSEALGKVFERRLLCLKSRLFQYLHDELRERKRQRNIQFFDDLLLNLHTALKGKGGEVLSRNIRDKFKAGLIDEFQDTDPIQYAIFKRIFRNGSVLFLIGDPKQAIYGFRGADIFAYMDAAVNVRIQYTLRDNWRSEPGLIKAVNAIFENTERPFVFEEIVFQRASAPAGKTDHELLKTDDGTDEPLQLWFVDAGRITGSEKALNKSLARNMIAEAVAAEISRLVRLGSESKASIGNRPLEKNDIAVLVRQNSEARIIQEALFDLNISSVLYTTESLFESHEALEIERVMAGISQPHNERLLRASLATDMMGVKGEELAMLMDTEDRWNEWLVRFREYHQQWEKQGFMRMIKSILSEQGVIARLTAFPDGERRATNLLHLSEVLHQASIEKRLSMTGLVKWLSEKRHSDTQGDEEHQLRLESDENAVKIVTIHKSKGLQYPIVFIPFSWGGSRGRDSKAPLLFHDRSDDMRLTLDLGSEDMAANRLLSEKEMLAENLRLLYVALTRAENRCYFVWGRFHEADTSAPAYLFHSPDTSPQDLSDAKGDMVRATSARFKNLSDRTVRTELETVCDRAGGAICISEMPDQAGYKAMARDRTEERLECRRFNGKIDQQFRISSFSSLVSKETTTAEQADRDAVGEYDLPDQMAPEAPILYSESSGIFSFPKGARAGTFMHDVLEHLDFTEKDPSHMNALVKKKLTEYGFDTTWKETICEMLKNVLLAPLEHGQKDFTLSRIPNKDRLNELGFYFPLRSISPEKLVWLFEKADGTTHVREFPRHMDRLSFSPVSGFMKGFMDMVFRFEDRYYLVDWKSNFLGNRAEDYGQDALYEAMMENFYFLQYHIYAAALNQYLKVRLPGFCYDKHFGAVYYIFLRGLDPKTGPDIGVYRDRPSEQFIRELSRELIYPQH